MIGGWWFYEICICNLKSWIINKKSVWSIVKPQHKNRVKYWYIRTNQSPQIHSIYIIFLLFTDLKYYIFSPYSNGSWTLKQVYLSTLPIIHTTWKCNIYSIFPWNTNQQKDIFLSDSNEPWTSIWDKFAWNLMDPDS